MNKKLCLKLSAWIMLLFVATACSKKTEYTNAIPGDATAVFSFNLNELGKKAGGSEENKALIEKMTEALGQSNLNAATVDQLKTIVKDPKASGIDLREPVYIFRSADFPVALLAKVNNEDDLQKLIGLGEKEQACTPVAEGEGYRYTTINNQLLLAFTPTTVIMTDYGNEAATQEKMLANLATVLKQTAENSINADEGFQKAVGMKKDITLYASYAALPKMYTEALRSTMPNIPNWEGMIILGGLSFEKGQIVIDMEPYAKDAELKAYIEKQSEATLPLQNKYLSNYPPATWCYLTMGVNGEKAVSNLQETNALAILPDGQRQLLEQLLKSLRNDVSAGAFMEKGMPTVLLCTETEDENLLKTFFEKATEQHLLRKNEMIQVNDQEYVFQSLFKVYFGIKDKNLYITNGEQLYKDLMAGKNPDNEKMPYADKLKGKNSAFILNIEAICSQPEVGLAMQSMRDKELVELWQIVQKMTHIEATSDGQHAQGVIGLKDKDQNALKFIVDNIKQLAGSF